MAVAETIHEGKVAVGHGGIGRWIIIGLLVVASGLVAGFYGINQYFSFTGTEIETVKRDSQRFETVFRDTSASRLETLQISLESLLNDRELVTSFVRHDRDALIKHITPFFQDVLLKEHNINQLNFFTPPAIEYLRVQEPKSFGADLSKVRKTILGAIERRHLVAAPEAGAGGVIGLRAVAPIFDDAQNVVGTIGLNDPFQNSLDRARATVGMDWAAGLDKERAEITERPSQPKVESFQGTDVYYVYSTPETGKVIRSLNFNSRAGDLPLQMAGDRTYFLRTFFVNNFTGKPTIVVATVHELTGAFAEAARKMAIQSGIIFLIASILSCTAYLQFRRIREGLTRALNRQRMELDEKSAFCEAAVSKLRDVDLVKRGFFTNLVAALNEPLQAISGHLQGVVRKMESDDPATVAEIADQLRFVLGEAARLTGLINDYHQIEVFRQNLVKGDSPLVSISAIVDEMLGKELARARRLPHLKIENAVPSDLPMARIDPDLLRRALAGLIGYAIEQGGRGRIVIAGSVDLAGWLRISITDSAFEVAGAPTDALLDEARQFLARLAGAGTGIGGGAGAGDGHAGHNVVAVVLSRIIIEFCGGTLDATLPVSGEAGFILLLPKAV